MFFVGQFACNASFPAVAHTTEGAGIGRIRPALERASRKQGARLLAIRSATIAAIASAAYASGLIHAIA
jgi:hypothetical protein